MQKVTKYALYGVPILIGAYLIYRQFRNARPRVTPMQPPENVPSVRGGGGGGGSSTPTNKCTYPISKNFSICEDIKDVQFYLNNIMPYSEIDKAQKWFSVKDDWTFFKNTTGDIVGCFSECGRKPLSIDGKLGDNTIALWNDTMYTDNPKTSFTKADVDELKNMYTKLYYNIQQAINFPVVSIPSPQNPKQGSQADIDNQPKLGF